MKSVCVRETIRQNPMLKTTPAICTVMKVFYFTILSNDMRD